jgi:tetratricopeptide (TPR) repeat protein
MRTKERAVNCARCYCPIAPPRSSKYVATSYHFFYPSARAFIRFSLLTNPLIQLTRHDDALIDTEASLLLQPGSFKALRTRARIRLHKEQYDDAIADFRSALEQAEFESADGDVRALRGELKRAEAALKRSKTKDYYKILGVPRDCNETDIKKAYRRESLKHHPDKVRRPPSPPLPRFGSVLLIGHLFSFSLWLSRAAMKKSSNWLPKPTQCFRTLIGANGMILARMRMVA